MYILLLQSVSFLIIICYSYCGLKDPSWSEINHFIKFLDVQLQSCELSVFCDSKLTGDIFSGLKGFVVKFMIRMSRDFATSSLTGEVAREDPHAEHVPQHDLAQYQIASRKGWEHRYSYVYLSPVNFIIMCMFYV